MPKLIRTGRTFGLLNRRLVTDAGGAPCCCGGAPCACVPGLILAPFRYVTCANGRYFPYTYAAAPSARLATVRLTWTMGYTEIVTSTVGNVPNTSARQGTYSGAATLCAYRVSSANNYTWVVSQGESAITYQSGGSSVETVAEAVNYSSQLALSSWNVGRTDEAGLYSVFRPGQTQSLTTFPEYRYPALGASTAAAGLPFGCNVRESVSVTTSSAIETGAKIQRYAATATDGSFLFDAASIVQSRFSPSRREVRVYQDVQWTIGYQTCDGDTSPQSLGGGCAGCGDASLLQII